MPTPNHEQITYWSEQAGPKWVEMQPMLDAQLAPLGGAAMDRLAPVAGERVLDVGCGCGATTLALAARVTATGHVTGLDVSPPMLALARARAEEAGCTNVTFVAADAATHDLEPASVDALFSRFGVMFFTDPTAAFARLRTTLRAGGRLAFICWQQAIRNEWVIVALEAATAHVAPPPLPAPGSPGPFAFADPDRVRSLLDEAGYIDVSIDSWEPRMVIGGSHDLDDATRFLLEVGPAAAALKAASADAGLAAAVTATLRERLAGHHGPSGVELGGATWLVTARNGA